MVGRGELVATHCRFAVMPGRKVTFGVVIWEGERGGGSERVRGRGGGEGEGMRRKGGRCGGEGERGVGEG